ncbi:MAG: isoleucine--tRNA ligase [Methanomassiliicoccales archaeon]
MPSKIKKASGTYDPAAIEKEIGEYWEKEDIYRKVKMLRSGGKRIYFLDGPPYTTGDVHLGTALNKFLKDLRIRYWRMRGFNVRDQPGWDMHGLPIEVNVEKAFGLKSKREIEEIGVEKFVQECRRYALSNLNNMTDQFRKLGVWMDWASPYTTISPEFTDAAWDMLSRAFSSNMLYEGLRSTQWCMRCGTALAEAEIEYIERKDPSIYVRFPLTNGDGALLIWTTTPWTIPANMAVAVHPDRQYALVEYSAEGKKERLIVLEEKAEEIGALAGMEEYEILQRWNGKQLEGTAYEYPLEGLSKKGKESEWSWKVICSETVETEYTGLVHTAPGHGPEDFELGKRYGIEAYSPVAEDGRFTSAAGEKLAGKRVDEVSRLVIEELERRGLLYYSAEITHRYGTCWRCKTPIIYRATSQWYIRASALKDRMLELISSVKWYPDWAGSSRQAEWARNLKDWCISRQRFWGTPLPVWKCECGESRLISSIGELSAGEGYTQGMDLHRPAIDQVTFRCDKCGSTMKRVPDVLDVWVDSGICSWASLFYPSKSEELDKWWPARWIVEAGDQTRGWFNSQLTTSIIVFNRSPFESAMLHGWVNDAHGRPMHKSLGNVINPLDVAGKEGVDALRFYMLSSRAPWDDLSFQPDGSRIAKKTLNILWNVYNFASTYMVLDNFEPSKVHWKVLLPELKQEDKWILSLTQRLIEECTNALESLEVHTYCRALQHFIVEDLSHWYIRLARDKSWTEEKSREKENAYTVMHYVLTELSRLMAPVTPFIAEEIYRALNSEGLSVHATSWPEKEEGLIDAPVEEQMRLAREIVEAVTKARQEAGLKLRWPLPRIVIKPKDDGARRHIGAVLDIIEKQSNTKASKLLQVNQEWDELVLKVVPNPNAIGKVYRQWSGKIALMLGSRPAAEIMNGIRKGSYTLGIEGQTVKIEENMVSFSYSLPKNVSQIEFSAGTVYVDFNIDEELEKEALSREVMRRIQKLRKQMNLQVDEFAEAEISAAPSLLEAILEWKGRICSECRLSDLSIAEEAKGQVKEAWKIDDAPLEIALNRKGGKVEEQEEEEMVLEAGSTYAIFEEKPERAFELFSSVIESGMAGLCISREYPEKLNKKYGLEKAKVLWLSSAGDRESIKPNDLERISLNVLEFLQSKQGIVLIDGIEYLISNNGFSSVVKLIQQLRDLTAKDQGILLLALNPNTLQQNDLGLLKKEVDNII